MRCCGACSPTRGCTSPCRCARAPTGREAAQALRFVDAMHDAGHDAPRQRRPAVAGAAPAAARNCARSRRAFSAPTSARRLLADFARRRGGSPTAPDADLVQPARDPARRRDRQRLGARRGRLGGRGGTAGARRRPAHARRDLARCARSTASSRAWIALKDDFMSSVTHELRTPLTSIRAFAELMRDDPQMDPAQRQQFLDLIVAESERLSRLVNQVLDMAKIESGHAEWRNEAIDLARARGPRRADDRRRLPRARRHGHGGDARRRCRRCTPTATACCRCCSTCCRTPPSSCRRTAAA